MIIGAILSDFNGVDRTSSLSTIPRSFSVVVNWHVFDAGKLDLAIGTSIGLIGACIGILRRIVGNCERGVGALTIPVGIGFTNGRDCGPTFAKCAEDCAKTFTFWRID